MTSGRSPEVCAGALRVAVLDVGGSVERWPQGARFAAAVVAFQGVGEERDQGKEDRAQHGLIAWPLKNV
jgi:hypothetical protein